jgi:hypothetical protein
MSTIENVYQNYKYLLTISLSKNNTLFMGELGLNQTDFLEKLLTDDYFNEMYGQNYTVELTEEEKLTSPPGHKRKLMD